MVYADDMINESNGVSGDRTWKIGELARLAGVSVRTLHHYDAIALLKPSGRSEGDYRLYRREDLLRLQQILFYRELDLPLEEVRQILDTPGFELTRALHLHRQNLLQRQKRLSILIATIDRTLASFTDKEKEMKDHEYYQGFIDPKTAEAYDREARERYGNAKVDESWQNIRKMGKDGFQKLLKDGESINCRLAALMHLEPQTSDVQAVIAEHFAFIGRFYEVTPEIYAGLAEMYVADARFKSYYEKVAPGLAEFLSAGMRAYLKTKGSR